MAFFDQPAMVLSQLRESWRAHDQSDLCRMIIAEPIGETDKSNNQTDNRRGEPFSPLPQIRRSLGANRFGSYSNGTKSNNRVLGDPNFSSSVGIEVGDVSLKKRRAVSQAEIEAQMVTHLVTWQQQSEENKKLQSQGHAFIFEKKEPKKASTVSGLSQIIKENRDNTNPYKEYTKYNGEGHVGAIPTVSCAIYLFDDTDGGETSLDPDAERIHMNVCVLRSGTVEHLIGLALLKWFDEGKIGSPPALDDMGVDGYELRDIDDGKPNMDFPALPIHQPMSKFGFKQLALIRTETTKKERCFINIHVPKQGKSTLIMKSLDQTVADLLAMVQKKRALAPDQHTLELKERPGMALDMSVTLRSLNSLDFQLIHKYSKRMDEVTDKGERTLKAQEQKQVEHSLKIYQYESYVVFKKISMFGRKEEIIFSIDGDKVSIIPYSNGSSSTWTSEFKLGGHRHAHQKLVSYNIDNVVRCALALEKSDKTFQFTVASKKLSTEYRTYEFEAKNADDAGRIVHKLTYILESRPSEVRSNYEFKLLEQPEGMPKRRWG
eukprot:CFRG4758T1